MCLLQSVGSISLYSAWFLAYFLENLGIAIITAAVMGVTVFDSIRTYFGFILLANVLYSIGCWAMCCLFRCARLPQVCVSCALSVCELCHFWLGMRHSTCDRYLRCVMVFALRLVPPPLQHVPARARIRGVGHGRVLRRPVRLRLPH